MSAERYTTEAIEALLASATPGEWGCWDAFDVVGTDLVQFHRIGASEGGVQAPPHCPTDIQARKADAALIAAAPTIIRQLLDAVRDRDRVLQQCVNFVKLYRTLTTCPHGAVCQSQRCNWHNAGDALLAAKALSIEPGAEQ